LIDELAAALHGCFEALLDVFVVGLAGFFVDREGGSGMVMPRGSGLESMMASSKPVDDMLGDCYWEVWEVVGDQYSVEDSSQDFCAAAG
jgi:hypothetical protein